MKSLVYDGPNQMHVAQRPLPMAARGEVRLRISACGICGSDIAGYQGLTGRRTPPLVMGHEFCGVIDDIGEACSGTFHIGDRVVVQPKDFCGVCGNCKAGLTNICEKNIPILGCIDVDGAFQEYLCVKEKLLLSMPESMTDFEGALIEPLAVAYGAVMKAKDLKGKSVLIVGGGTIGLMVLSIVKAMGAGRIIVSDLNRKRFATAKQMGAAAVVDPSEGDFTEQMLAATDGALCDVAFECVGMSPTVQQAMMGLKQFGTAVWVGNNRKMIEINMQQIVTRELRVFGTFIYTHEEFAQAMQFLHENHLDLRHVITKVVSLEQAPETFAALAKSQQDDLKVIVKI